MSLTFSIVIRNLTKLTRQFKGSFWGFCTSLGVPYHTHHNESLYSLLSFMSACMEIGLHRKRVYNHNFKSSPSPPKINENLFKK